MVGVKKNLTFLESFMVATEGYFIQLSFSFIQSLTHVKVFRPTAVIYHIGILWKNLNLSEFMKNKKCVKINPNINLKT